MKGRILILQDAGGTLNSISSMLAEAGHDVATAGDVSDSTVALWILFTMLSGVPAGASRPAHPENW